MIGTLLMEQVGVANSVMYFSLRVRSLNRRLEVTHSAALFSDGRRFDRFIHDRLADLQILMVDVDRANIRWRWTMFESYVVFMPIICLNLMTAFFADMPMVFNAIMTVTFSAHVTIVATNLASAAELCRCLDSLRVVIRKLVLLKD